MQISSSSRRYIAVVVASGLSLLVSLMGLPGDRPAHVPVAQAAARPAPSGASSAGTDNPQVLNTLQDEIRRSEYAVTWQPAAASFQAPNRAAGLRTYFTDAGIRVQPRTSSPAAWQLELQLAGSGAPGRMQVAAVLTPTVQGNRAEYLHPEVTEWYLNTEAGLEQGFTFNSAREGAAQLQIELTLAGDVHPLSVEGGQAIAFFDETGNPVLRYSNLHAQDAGGKLLPSSMYLKGCAARGDCHLLLTVDAAQATYPVTIDPLIQGISTFSDWTLDGDQAGADVGFAVGTAGDVNGDGYADVYVAAPAYDDGVVDIGRVYVFLGSSNGLTTTANWMAEGDQVGARFGAAVSSAGDVNGDGFADLLIGAPCYSHGETGEGRAYLYPGSGSGLSNSAAWWAESNQANAHLGWSVSSAGDVNGDGYADVIVGAPYYDASASLTDSGRLFVYHGSSSGLSAYADWTLDGDQSDGLLGWAVSGAGDVNADGYADILAGVPGYSLSGAASAGRALLYRGSSSGLLSNTGVTMDGSAGGRLGSALAAAGDVNGDGYADVIIGAPDANAELGRVSLYAGSMTGILTTSTWTTDGPTTTLHLGASVASAGDVNGDGYADVIIGTACATQESVCVVSGTNDLVEAAVYLGAGIGVQRAPVWEYSQSEISTTLHSAYAVAVGTAGDVNGDGFSDVIVGMPRMGNGQVRAFNGSPSGLNRQVNTALVAGLAGAGLGAALSTAGDVNGDGYADVIVAAPDYDAGAGGEGRAWVYAGSASGLVTTTTWMTTGVQANAHLGAAVSNAGDVNGDGYSDVLIGAPDASGILSATGNVYLYEGSSSGLGSSPAWVTQGVTQTERLGASVSTAGDVNGDGYADVLIGAPGYSAAYTSQGRVLLYVGSAAGIVLTPTWQGQGSAAGEDYGWAVASAGDTNADGYSDIVIGAPGYHQAGRALIYTGTLVGPASIAAWQLSGDQTGARYGASVAGAGDVNGDGYADILVGAPAYTLTETSEGRAFLYAGSLTGTLTAPAWTYGPNVTGAQLGAALGTAGDVDGDGLADVIIGAPGIGWAYVFYGTRSGLAAAPDWFSPGDQFDTQYGAAVGAAGDVNGDGFADILVGDPGVDHPLVDEGQVTLYYGAGVRGYPMRMRQVQRDGLTPLAPQGLTVWSSVVQLQTSARAAWGTARARLAWQAAPVGQPFTATGVLSGTGGWSSTLPLGTWLTSTVSGLQPNTAYHWRVRLLYRPNPLALRASRWLHGPAAGQLETMLRTRKLVPLGGLVATQNGPTTVGSTKQFTASVISGTEAVYTWALGDGNAASGASITHTYTATGVYTALVTATNGMSVLTSTLAVTITDVPLAGLIVTNTSPVRPGGVVTLSAALLTGTATSSAWAFGDGAVGAGMLVTHVYTTAGLYTAALTVTRGADVLSAHTPITVYKQLFLPVVLDRWPYMPGTPTLKLVDAIGATFYSISWSSVSDASSYQLQESTSPAFTSPTTLYNGTQTTYSVSGKTLGTTYYYRVASITATYQSGWSNVVSTAVTLASNSVVNGGFENGIPPPPWVERSTMGELISSVAVRSGRYAAYLGGVIDTEDTLYQPVAIASNAISPTLTFWHKISTTDTVFYPYDTLSCVVWDTSGTVLGSCGQLSNVNRSDGWVQSTADLSAYAGKLVRIGFRSYNNSLYPTQFFIDDVSITTKN